VNQRPRGGTGWPAWAAFLALAAVLCWDKVFGPFALVRLFDSFESEYPHYVIQARLLLDHGLFHWNPFMPGGMPALAGQHGPLHPLVLACALLPPWMVSGLLDLFLLALAGWGLYRLCRDFTGSSRSMSATGAAISVFSLVPFLRHFLLGHAFPACFIWLARAADPQRSLTARLGNALALAATLALAYPVLSLPVGLVHLLLAATLPAEKAARKRLVLATLLLWTGYALLNAPVVAGLWEYLPLAHRSHEVRAVPLGQALLDFARVFVNQLWDDQPCFPFLFLGLPFLVLRGPGRGLFAAVLLVCALRGLGNSDLRFLLGTGPLTKPDWAVVFQLTPALLAALAVRVLDRMRARPPGPAWTLAALAATLVLGRFQSSAETLLQVLALALGLSAVALARERDRQAALLPGPQAPCWLDRFPGARVPAFSLALALALMTATQQLLLEHTHVPYVRAFSGPPLLDAPGAGPFRAGSADLHPAVALGQGIETVDQKRPLFNRYWKDLIGLAIDPQTPRPEDRERFRRDVYHLLLTPRRPGTDLFLAPARPPERSIRDFDLALLGAMNMRFLLSSRPIQGLEGQAQPPRMVRIGGAPHPALADTALDRFLSQDVYVHELPWSLDRAFLATRAEVLGSREEVLTRLGRAGKQELADTAFFFAGDLDRAGAEAARPDLLARPNGLNGSDGQAERTGQASPSPALLAIHAPDPDRLVAKGIASGPAYLVVSNNFDQGWTATVNGSPAELLRVNHAFQAVPILTDGPFTAELAFAHPVPRLLLWAMAPGVVLMLLPALLWPRKTKRRKKEAAPASGGVFPDSPATGCGMSVRNLSTPDQPHPGQPHPGQPIPAQPPPGQTPPNQPTRDRTGPTPSAPQFRSAPLWAALMAGIWAAGFSVFIYARGAAKADPRPLGYVLAVVPVLGVLAGCWTRALLLGYFLPSACVPPARPEPRNGQDQDRT
jgi:hypothetical protein